MISSRTREHKTRVHKTNTMKRKNKTIGALVANFGTDNGADMFGVSETRANALIDQIDPITCATPYGMMIMLRKVEFSNDKELAFAMYHVSRAMYRANEISLNRNADEFKAVRLMHAAMQYKIIGGINACGDVDGVVETMKQLDLGVEINNPDFQQHVQESEK